MRLRASREWAESLAAPCTPAGSSSAWGRVGALTHHELAHVGGVQLWVCALRGAGPVQRQLKAGGAVQLQGRAGRACGSRALKPSEASHVRHNDCIRPHTPPGQPHHRTGLAMSRKAWRAAGIISQHGEKRPCSGRQWGWEQLEGGAVPPHVHCWPAPAPVHAASTSSKHLPSAPLRIG